MSGSNYVDAQADGLAGGSLAVSSVTVEPDHRLALWKNDQACYTMRVESPAAAN